MSPSMKTCSFGTVLTCLLSSLPTLLPTTIAYTDDQYDEVMDFLIDNQPTWDVGVVTHDAMNESVSYALLARDTFPQLSQYISWDMFVTYATPYAVLDEGRDNWRRWMFEYVQPFVPAQVESGNVSNALFAILNAAYQTRSITFQSNLAPVRMTPLETLVWGHSSCTGMSIYGAAVLKAVGWPVRVTGTIWNNGNPFDTGDMAYNNHNWIEVWDVDNGGVWSYVDASSASFSQWNQTWFTSKTCSQIANNTNYSVTSAVWSFDDATDGSFSVALPWNLNNRQVPAVDVTLDYQTNAGCAPS